MGFPFQNRLLTCRFRPSAASIPSSHPFHRRTANLENPGNVFSPGPVHMGLITQQQDAPVGLLVSRPPATGSSCRSALSLTRYLFIAIPSSHVPILFALCLVQYTWSVLISKMLDY